MFNEYVALLFNKFKFYSHLKWMACFAIYQIFIVFNLFSQRDTVINSLEEAINIGLTNNRLVNIAEKEIDIAERNKKKAFNIDHAEVQVYYGQMNSQEFDTYFEINQQFAFPTVYSSQRKLANAQKELSIDALTQTKNRLRREILREWMNLSFLSDKKKLMAYQDSINQRFLTRAKVLYESGVSSLIEKLSIESKIMEFRNDYILLKGEVLYQQQRLRTLLFIGDSITFDPEPLKKIPLILAIDTSKLRENVQLQIFEQEIEIANLEKSVFSSLLAPNILLGYFNQTMFGFKYPDGRIATGSDQFQGIQVKVSFPLFFGSYKADVKNSELKKEIARSKYQHYYARISGLFNENVEELNKYRNSLKYFEEFAIPQANQLLKTVEESFDKREIDYIEFYDGMRQAIGLKFDYLRTLNIYNRTIIHLQYLTGK